MILVSVVNSILITLINSFDRFVTHFNMFINCPNVLLLAGFVQSLVCRDLPLKYVSRFQSMLTELNLLMDSLRNEIAEQRCRKETCIDVKNLTRLLIFNLVFQINFQAVFNSGCAQGRN